MSMDDVCSCAFVSSFYQKNNSAFFLFSVAYIHIGWLLPIIFNYHIKRTRAHFILNQAPLKHSIDIILNFLLSFYTLCGWMKSDRSNIMRSHFHFGQAYKSCRHKAKKKRRGKQSTKKRYTRTIYLYFFTFYYFIVLIKIVAMVHQRHVLKLMLHKKRKRWVFRLEMPHYIRNVF